MALRIAYFTNSVALGGMEKHVTELAAVVARSGCEVCVIAPGSSAVAPFVEQLRARQIPVYTLDLSGAQPIRRLASEWLRLRRLLQTRQIEVFHQHRTGPYHGKWACLAARAAGVHAIVVTEHLPAFRLTGASRLINRAADSVVDRVVTVCELDRTRQLSSTWRGERKVVTIHNGVDITQYRHDSHQAREARVALGVDKRAPVIGVIARLAKVKGITYLMKALPVLSREWPDLMVLIAGEGSEREALEAEARALGVGHHVRFLGLRGDVPAILQAIDLLVLPSENESLPLVLLEAMAMQRASVATDVGGVSEAIIDGETGCLVPPCDPDALAEVIGRCLRGGELAAMGHAARERVERLFTLDVMTAKSVALYRSLLQERAGA